MAGIKQDPNGKWKIDRGFLTPERAKIMQRLDKKHAAAKAQAWKDAGEAPDEQIARYVRLVQAAAGRPL